MVAKEKQQARIAPSILQTMAAEASPADEDLLALARAGDTGAFGTLVVRYQSRVLGYLRHLTRGAPIAEDLAQQTFLRAWEKLSSFHGANDGSASFPAWLTRIAYREFLQRSRRAKLEAKTFVAENSSRPGSEYEPIDQSSDNAEPRFPEFSELLRPCSAQQQHMLYMNYVLELSHDEICRVTGESLGTVKSHIRRGKVRIRASLDEATQKSTLNETKQTGIY